MFALGALRHLFVQALAAPSLAEKRARRLRTEAEVDHLFETTLEKPGLSPTQARQHLYRVAAKLQGRPATAALGAHLLRRIEGEAPPDRGAARAQVCRHYTQKNAIAHLGRRGTLPALCMGGVPGLPFVGAARRGRHAGARLRAMGAAPEPGGSR